MQKRFVVLFVLLITLKQFLWMVYMPLWHFPDEQAHFGQVQNIAEGLGSIFPSTFNTSREIAETEGFLGTFRDWGGNNLFTYHPEFNITYSQSKTGVYENLIRSFPKPWRTEMVIKEATVYPPLYYSLSAVFYSVFETQSIFERVMGVRILNLVFFLCTVYGAYLIAKLLFPKLIVLQMALVLLVSFHPMFSFLSAGINSYNIFNMTFTYMLYLCLLVLEKGLKPRYLLLMLLLLFLNIAGKSQGKLTPFIYLYPLVVSFIKYRDTRTLILLTGVVSFFVGIGAFLKSIFAGQQFLPDVARISGLTAAPELTLFGHVKNSIRQTMTQTVPWYFGVYRWLSMVSPPLVIKITNRVLIGAVLGLFVHIVMRMRARKTSHELVQIGFLAYASIVYYAGIIFYDYLFIKTHNFSLGIQGRYFFPTIVFHMALLLIGITSWIPVVRVRNLVAHVLGFGMVALHTFIFFWVHASYFDTSSFGIFFRQASQNKALWAKSPFLELYIGVFCILCVITLGVYINNQFHAQKKT